MREFSQSFPQGDAGCEAEVPLEGRGVGVGGGHVARLHGDELLVGLEVVVGRQYARRDKFLLEDLNEVQQVFGLAAADVVDGIGDLPHRGLPHDADDAFDDVIDVGKVAAAVAVVENLDGLAAQQFVGEAEVRHVGAAGWAIDREEAQARGRDVVEFRVAVREKLVALLRGRVEAHRIVDAVVDAERDLLVAAVNAGGGSVNQMLNAFVIEIPGQARNDVFGMPAGFQDVVEAHHVALDVGVGVLDAVADTGLRRQVHDDVKRILRKQLVDQFFVGDVALEEHIVVLRMLPRPGLDEPQAVLLQRRVVVVVQVVQPDDPERFRVKPGMTGMVKPGMTGNPAVFQ